MKNLCLLLAVAGIASGLTGLLPAAEPASAAGDSDSIRLESLTTSSPVIIHDGRNWTMVPAGAFIQLPDSLRHRLSTRPLGNLISWKNFLELNREWLKAEEVSIRQVNGRDALDSRRLRYLASTPLMVIATHDHQPAALSPVEPSMASSDRH